MTRMSLLSPPLLAFIAVVKHKTVHAAAKALHITQTAVTQRIHTLEEKLSTTLFIRERRGMLLTPEGEALLRYCHAANELEGAALAKIKGAGIDTDIQVCITGPSSIMRARIITQCVSLIREYPHLLLQFDVNDLDARVRALRTGDCQLAVIRVEDLTPDLEYKILKPEHYILVCSAAWKKRKLEDIIREEHIVDYDPQDQITFNYLKKYNLFHLAKHERHFVNRTDALASMLISGYGYGLLTKEFSETDIKQKELMVLNKGKSYENTLALAWFPRYEPPKYFKALVDAIH